MEYNFSEIEKKWQQFWSENKVFKAENDSTKDKYYVLDMFPYPSGAGLHVGHPLGYIASDIVARYKRHKGFNVSHPMGYDSFGLPAEQYAIQTGQHPAVTTEENIATYRRQLDQIGFSFDWDREVRTSDPAYYEWTQWIFIQLFNSWYNKDTDRAEDIATIEKLFIESGNEKVNAVCDAVDSFSADEWKTRTKEEQQLLLLNYRLAYLSETMVNWCPALGTVLANDEVKDGVSERGGHPVVQKKMQQWSMRISAYAERLLSGLESLDWTEHLKEIQRNWIGKSQGASLKFKLRHPELVSGSNEQMLKQVQHDDMMIEVFTTRPDTIFGVTYMTLAPEHELVAQITTPEQREEVEAYVEASAKRSERDRMSDVKTISGAFTGAYAVHPFTNEPIPIWIGDYVLASYGTGAVMAVPAHDSRDYAFAKHFNLPIKEVVKPTGQSFDRLRMTDKDSQAKPVEAYDAKEGELVNSDFLNGLKVKKAIKQAIYHIEQKGIGKGQTNYRLRDAVFGRQRYWGEPIPIYYDNGVPYTVDEADLPITLPEVDKYLPTEDGEPPLARAKDWKYKPSSSSSQKEENFEGYDFELSTMPGWAGSSWYFLRYMNPDNSEEFVSQQATNYWQQIDLYLGGSEHATGHLLYFRFWTKFLKDRGYINIEEPAKKLINQGMISGESAFTHRLNLVLFKALKPELTFEINGKNLAQYSFASSFVLSKSIAQKLIDGDVVTEQLIKEKLDEKYKKSHPDFNSNILGKDYEIYFKSESEERIIKRHVNTVFVNGKNELDLEKVERDSMDSLKTPEFFLEENGKFICSREIEKMSKSKYNVVNPDDIITDYGADTLRMYEMFLGPLEQSKPWNTNGIDGVHKFLKKFWRLFENGISDEKASKEALKVAHETIKKIEWDIENFSFNTSVSQFMICTNKLTELKCNKREILEPLVICLSPYAPHISEELWQKLGYTESISNAPFPEWQEEYLKEDNHKYPVSVNGKTRVMLDLPIEMPVPEIQKEVLANEVVQKWLNGKDPKKIIVVPKRIVNIVV